MTEGVFDITSKQRVDGDATTEDIAALVESIQALIKAMEDN